MCIRDRVRVDQDFVNVGNTTTNVSMTINAQDRCGSMIPSTISGNTTGMTWSANAGTNNTLGRLLRLQRDYTLANPNYYDFGIGDSNYFFITILKNCN
jgi:hypothetical protein